MDLPYASFQQQTAGRLNKLVKPNLPEAEALAGNSSQITTKTKPKRHEESLVLSKTRY